MAGRHSKRRETRSLIPEQRGPRPVRVVNAHTPVEYLLTDESVVSHCHAGPCVAHGRDGGDVLLNVLVELMVVFAALDRDRSRL